ncbi:MAG: NDP-sugar synthase [Acidobacteriota bacterium]|nr:NDP-sugar synthase [Acidobacteriota bacterium]
MPRRAMVFAAGRGERMGPLTRDRAKPSLPFCGVPLLTRLLRWLTGAGVSEVVVNLHHHPGTLEPLLVSAERTMRGLTIGRSPEPELLGTSGGLSRAAARFGLGSDAGGPLLVLNGDTLPTFDLGEMAGFHGAAGAEATLLADPEPGPEFSGERRLETREDRVITGLSGPGGPGFGFSGVWLLEPAALGHLHGGRGGLSQDLLPGLIAAGTARAFPSRAPWFEIGTPRRYLEASLRALEGGALPESRTRPADAARTDSRSRAAGRWPELIGEGSVVGEAACVEGSLLLEDVRIGARAAVRDSIVAAAETVPAGARIEAALFAGGAATPL